MKEEILDIWVVSNTMDNADAGVRGRKNKQK